MTKTELKPANGEPRTAPINGKHKRLDATLPRAEGLRIVPPVEASETRAEIEEVVESLRNAIEMRQARASSKFERASDSAVEQLSKPVAVWAQTAVIAAYVTLNTLAVFKVVQFDPYPFLFLNTILSLASAYTTVLVLNSNRRQDDSAKALAKANADALTITMKLLERVDASNRAQTKVLNRLAGYEAAETNKEGR